MSAVTFVDEEKRKSNWQRLLAVWAPLLVITVFFFYVLFSNRLFAGLVLPGYQAPISDIQRINFQSPRFSYAIERLTGTPEQSWIFTEPEPALVIDEFIPRLFSVFEQFQFGEALTEVDSDSREFMPERPEGILQLSSAGGESFSIRFGRRNEYLARRYAMIGSERGLYAPPDILLPILDRNPVELQQRTPLAYLSEKLRSVRYSSGIALEQNLDSLWLVNGKPADQLFVREYLKRLTGLQVLGYESGTVEQGAQLLSIHVRYEHKDGPLESRLDIFESTDKQQAFLRTSDLPVTMRLERNQVKRLKPSLELLQVVRDLDAPGDRRRPIDANTN